VGRIVRRLERLEAMAGAPTPETERERTERLRIVREQAEHANHCLWSGKPAFVIDEEGAMFASRDGKPITEPRQTLAEEWYWKEAEEWGGEGLVHDEEAQAFYTPSGELALSCDLVDLQRYMGDARWEHLR
jgi:hypothetical protein